MTLKILTAAGLALLTASAASAEQFVVQLDGVYQSGDLDLQKALKVSEIATFTEGGRHYLILDAPNDAYIESYLMATHNKVTELGVLDADWTKPVMSELTVTQRLRFSTPIECEICVS